LAADFGILKGSPSVTVCVWDCSWHVSCANQFNPQAEVGGRVEKINFFVKNETEIEFWMQSEKRLKPLFVISLLLVGHSLYWIDSPGSWPFWWGEILTLSKFWKFSPKRSKGFRHMVVNNVSSSCNSESLRTGYQIFP
jgi:hypothetical protein